ncbi:unnamed protein product [Symbiodinium natans]|uniref:Pentatricopeptide repeat-containing protein, chloroplastic n=1 Tax=Symbiodinium natans TaxID=878477 RepID=A0A812GR60_9DINO|nr:unnamed protein product [Symbiodinium natans]
MAPAGTKPARCPGGTVSELNRILISHGRKTSWMQSILVLDQMQEVRVQPDVYTCSSAINSCQLGAWQMALQCFDRLSQTVLPNPVVYTTLMMAFSKHGEWQQALFLFHSLVVQQIQTDTILHSAAVKACEDGSQWQVALRILHDLSKQTLLPDTAFLNSAISACEKSDQGEAWAWGLELLRCLWHWVLLPDAISFSAAISACEKAFQWPAALLLLADVQSCSLELDIILCNAALSSCSKGPAQ